VPVESAFARCEWVDQQCLLGRGYSKTVMVCVLCEAAKEEERDALEQKLHQLVNEVNESVDKSARIGAIIVTQQAWSIENGVLTPTLKIKRDEVEARFGEQAQQLAHQSAVNKKILVDWS